MKRAACVFSFLVFFGLSPLSAQGDVLADIRDVGPYDVKYDGFVLDSGQEVSIHAVAAGDRYRGIGTSAVILEKSTRTVVWNLRNARVHNRSRGLADYDDAVQLPKGEYEVHFAAYPEPSDGIESFGDFVDFLSGRIFDGKRRNREYRDLNLTIHGRGQHLGQEGVDRWQQDVKKGALLSLTALWDNDYVHQGFVLEKPTDVDIYAVGEDQDQTPDDYGWIINAKTGMRVWQMTDENMKSAGGARKNRVVRETMTLPAGQYAAYFVTDGSHSYKEWNAPPPYDPSFWGITLWVKDEAQRKYAKTFEYKPSEQKNIIVDLTRVGDHGSLTKSFALRRAMDVRIYALGEGRDREMNDYGWIVDASSHRRVWKMEYDETEHAGGDQKNRLVDKVIHLDKGNYVVHYVTDDNHSYRDWNSSPPFDQEHWGITVSVADDRFDPKDVAAFEDRGDPSALASIVRVGNDERRRKDFSLMTAGDVHIYSVGEGRDGDMYDYAWIEDAKRGKVVWKMKYRMTDHAGGAEKNRVFDGTISLPAGNYTVFYETDDTHAYDDWNDTPPDDPEGWGVTVSLARAERR